eukprot:m.440857 g.440857  ORF g.440857 m.440857 type:complete len:1001 (+) comp21466_c0_seq41:741-3743(+)
MHQSVTLHIKSAAVLAMSNLLSFEQTEQFEANYTCQNSSGRDAPWISGVAVVVESTDAQQLMTTSTSFTYRNKVLPFTVKKVELFRPELAQIPSRSGEGKHRRYFHALGFMNWNISLEGEQMLLHNGPAYTCYVACITRSCRCGALQWKESVDLRQLKSGTYTFSLIGDLPSEHGMKCTTATEAHRVSVTSRVGVKLCAQDLATTASSLSVRGHVPQCDSSRKMNHLLSGGAKLPMTVTSKTLAYERARRRNDLPPFEAVHELLRSALLKAVTTTDTIEYVSDTFPIVAYHPAPDPHQTGQWPQAGWFVLIEMPQAVQLMQKYGAVSGVLYDDKEQVTRDGGQLTLFGVAIPGKPKRLDGSPINSARWQHTAGLTHACLNNSGSSGYYTALTECILRDIPCESHSCAHKRLVHRTFGGAGGFFLQRECCSENKVEWHAETSDLCTASMSSCFSRRRSQDSFPQLKHLFACYTHDDRAHMKAVARLLQASSNPVVLDRAMRAFRWLFHCQEDDVARRFDIWKRLVVPMLSDSIDAQEKYIGYIYKTRVEQNLPIPGGLWRPATHAVRHRQSVVPLAPLNTNIIEVLNRTIVLEDKDGQKYANVYEAVDSLTGRMFSNLGEFTRLSQCTFWHRVQEHNENHAGKYRLSRPAVVRHMMACAVLLNSGVQASVDPSVLYVSHKKAYVRQITTRSREIRSGFPSDVTTHELMIALMEEEQWSELSGAPSRLSDGETHRVSVERDNPVCEGDLQTLHYKDGWLAEVGRMVWEQLCIDAGEEFDTTTPSDVVTTESATRNAIKNAERSAEAALVEMMSRLHLSCLRPLPDEYFTMTTEEKARYLAIRIGTHPSQSQGTELQFQRGGSMWLRSDTQRPRHGFRTPSFTRGPKYKVPAVAKNSRKGPIQKAISKRKRVEETVQQGSDASSAFDMTLQEMTTFAEYNPGYAEVKEKRLSRPDPLLQRYVVDIESWEDELYDDSGPITHAKRGFKKQLNSRRRASTRGQSP